MKTVACYVRCSTTQQNPASQKREIQRYLDGHKIKNVVWFVDAKTGDNLDRPAFKRLQTAVFNGEIQTVVVYKLDRLSRTLLDGINTLCGWLKAGIRVISTTQQLDFSGATGQLVAATLFAVAQMEQETRRERQAAGIAAVMADKKLRREKYQGRKPASFKGKPVEAVKLSKRGLETIGDCKAVGHIQSHCVAIPAISRLRP